MIKNIELTIDHRIAQNEREAIIQAIHEVSEKTMAEASAILQNIKPKFPVIAAISAELLPINDCIITVKACEPIMRINRDSVWTRQGILLPQNVFVKRLVKPLSLIFVQFENQQKTHIMACCADFIASLTASILEKYTVSWVDENEIHLQDNTNEKFAIYVHNNIPLDTCIATSNAIKEDLKKRGKFESLNETQLVADARFDGQIVVREQGGGNVTR